MRRSLIELRISENFVTKPLIEKSFSHNFLGKRVSVVSNSLIDQRFSHNFVGKPVK